MLAMKLITKLIVFTVNGCGLKFRYPAVVVVASFLRRTLVLLEQLASEFAAKKRCLFQVEK